MKLVRKKMSEADRRFIIGRSGGRCNRCRRELFIQNEFGEKARLGEEAHIVAFSPKGPRGNDIESIQLSRDIQNIILLCKNCHVQIDDQPLGFSVESLQLLRDNHYKWVEERLGEFVAEKPRIHYLYYMNLIRLDIYSVMNSLSLPSIGPADVQNIRQLGLNAGRLMASYTAAINQEDLYGNTLDNKTNFSDIAPGSYWFIPPTTFRSKKIDEDSNHVKKWEKLESSIYKKFRDFTLYCLIDPRWIPTSTSYCSLRKGVLNVTGVVHVSTVEFDKKIAIASPLFLGSAA